MTESPGIDLAAAAMIHQISIHLLIIVSVVITIISNDNIDCITDYDTLNLR